MHIDAFYQFLWYHPRFDNINKMTPTTYYNECFAKIVGGKRWLLNVQISVAH